MRIGGRVFSVIRPFAPVVTEAVDGLGLGLTAARASVGHGCTFGAGRRTVLNAFVPIVRLGFGLAAFGILTSARVGIGYHVVHPSAEVAGVCLINHGESKIIMQNAMQNPADIIVNAVEITPRFIFVNTLFHRIFHDIFVKVGVEIDLKIAFVFACRKSAEIRFREVVKGHLLIPALSLYAERNVHGIMIVHRISVFVTEGVFLGGKRIMNASRIQEIPYIGQNVAASIGHLVGQNGIFAAIKRGRTGEFDRCGLEIESVGLPLLDVKRFNRYVGRERNRFLPSVVVHLARSVLRHSGTIQCGGRIRPAYVLHTAVGVMENEMLPVVPLIIPANVHTRLYRKGRIRGIIHVDGAGCFRDGSFFRMQNNVFVQNMILVIVPVAGSVHFEDVFAVGNLQARFSSADLELAIACLDCEIKGRIVVCFIVFAVGYNNFHL